MPFIKDNHRRQLRRLSSKSAPPVSTVLKEESKATKVNSENAASNRKKRESKGMRHGGATETRARGTEIKEEGRSSKDSRQDNVDVFAFMEKDGSFDATDSEQADSDVPDLSSSASSTSSQSNSPSPHLQSPYSDLEVHPVEEKTGFMWQDHHRRDSSINSDSGVSMLSGSPDGDSPVLSYKNGFQRHRDDTPTAGHAKMMSGLITTSIPETSAARLNHVPPLDLRYVEEPESFYGTSPHPSAQTPRTATTKDPQAGLQPSWQSSPYESSSGSIPPPAPQAPVSMEKSGYDLLASAIGSRDASALKPIYRKFEILNNRLLLSLQDEISGMEEGLQRLDASITHEEARGTNNNVDSHMYLSQLKWHRQELMHQTFAKVEQYSTSHDLTK